YQGYIRNLRGHRMRTGLGAILVAATVGCVLISTGPAFAIDSSTLYPGAAPGATHVLNQTALMGNVNDSAWFTSNIPFLEVPDAQIQQVYYYRWQTYKEHLVYTG